MLITRYEEARAVLSDIRYVPPPVRQDAPEGTLAWLRARVSRFSTGAAHAERRRLVTELLAALDPGALRSAARAMTLERHGDWAGVHTAVLGRALGVDGAASLVAAVEAVSTGYLSGAEGPEADAGVAELVRLFPGEEAETVARVSVLLQAHAAIAGLVGNALAHARPGVTVEALLHETLRQDPPLKATRRLDLRTGDEVVIDLVAANRDPDVFPEAARFDPTRGETPHLTFGYGVRPCPAPAHALALAAGVLDALLEES
ncbi:cytochrome P450 [Nonomuraea sp. NPDC000554]|uniref:cytochrome P450 n=1 Tax=Nonomuraea sp. NPDC000554 TaxID=3154259 RepID=UPI00331A3850